MQEEILCKHIENGLSQRQIATKEKSSLGTVRYWLKYYGLKTRAGPKSESRDLVSNRRCACGEARPEKFYGNKKRRCAKCQNKDVIENSRRKRKMCIEMLGGKCVACGFDKYSCSLDLHHVDPLTKGASFKMARGWSNGRLFAEIKKCVLLCKNCHAAYHAGLIPSSWA